MVAGLLLLVVYAGLSFALNDPRGTLGTDTGGKLATLRTMERHGGLDPDIGYWAEREDPAGVLHPLYYTYRVGRNWVNVTTLPMLYAAYPLYRIGGDRAVLLLPMLGAVFSAFAARALARRLGGGTGWTAFWAIGLASPVAIYALDFWEHSVGLAFMLWGVVFVLDVIDAASWLAGCSRRRRAVRCCRDLAPRGACLPRGGRCRLGHHARGASTRLRSRFPSWQRNARGRGRSALGKRHLGARLTRHNLAREPGYGYRSCCGRVLGYSNP